MVRQLTVLLVCFYTISSSNRIHPMDTQEIKSAVRIHEYIGQLENLTKLSLKSSPIILGFPRKKVTFDIPVLSKPCFEYVEQLYEDIGEHDLLLQALRTGWHYINSNCKPIATTKEKYFQQLNSSHSFRIAKQRGYQVPNNLLNNKQFCYGQYEAYSAIHDILHGKASGMWSIQSSLYDFMHSYAKFYKTVKLITSQFIVPSTGYQLSIPYIVDQLWLISQGINQVRLLGLAVAGEQHFLNGGQSNTFGQEKYLEELGYEMYHVASWWCRVDPYRVICEFLRASGIFPEAVNYLIGSELDSIDQYVCGICHAPMVRLGCDWIQKCQIGNETVFAHKYCANHSVAETVKTRRKLDVRAQIY